MLLCVGNVAVGRRFSNHTSGDQTHCYWNVASSRSKYTNKGTVGGTTLL
jgi:hypothetical protein